MKSVFASYNNIISSLGFTTEENSNAVLKEQSGIKKYKGIVSSEDFYASFVDKKELNNRFSELADIKDYTILEKMMILSLQDVLHQANVSINDRTGLIISTTKGNIDCLDVDSSFSSKRAYLHAISTILKNFFGFKNEPIIVSNACVSGLLSVAIAKRFIQNNVYDEVFVVSGDLVSKFTLSGFNSFQAISEFPCKPFSKNRTGISIGEASASMLITANKKYVSKDAVEIIGDGSCNDANHISGPSRTGEGLVKSMESAFLEANITSAEIDYISAHGTATNYNDEMEAIAFDRMQLNNVPTNSLKGYYGHTLGASGLLETIIGMQSAYNNMLYTSLGFDELGVSKKMNIIDKPVSKEINLFLKTASGFGGCNTAVIFKKER